MSLENQKLEADWELEVIVVDNDPLKLGSSIVKEFENSLSFNIFYYEQPIKNISLTRNKGVAMAKGELVFFIDDDGFAIETWMMEMINCMRKYKADAVFGTVLPYYEEGVPEWIKKGEFFERLIQETGEKSKFTRTGNCLVKSILLKSLEGPFDPKFGLTGGEDVNLFEKLSRSYLFIFCKEGIVFDFIPKERATFFWIFKRHFRTGSTFTKNKILSSKNKIMTRIFYIFRSILGILFSIFKLFIYAFSHSEIIKNVFRLSSYIGHLSGSINLVYKEYKR